MNALRTFRLLFCAGLGLAVLTHASAASIASQAIRSTVAGIDVIVYPMGVKDVVTVEGSLPAGDAFAAGGNVAAASLAGLMLDKGTTKQDKFAIAKQLDDVGAQIGFQVGEQTTAISAKSLKKDLPLVIHLLAEELRMPAFSPEEFAKAKKQLEGGLRPMIEDVRYRSHDAFSRMIYGAGHPNRMADIPTWLADTQKITLDEAKAFYRAHYGPAHLTLIFVGDVDAKVIQSQLGREFAGWSGGVDVPRSVIGGSKVSASLEDKVVLKDKTSISVTFGQATGLRYQDADTVALRVGTAILGTGFTGRLMSSIRDREGLTYGIGAGVSEDTFVDGSWSINAAFAPTLVDKGIVSTRRELEKWWQEGVTAAELAARKTSMIGTYQVSLATTDGMAGMMLQTLNRGKPLSWLDDYPNAIQALTVEQVNAAIRKHLDPKKMVLVEAGTFEAKAPDAKPPAR